MASWLNRLGAPIGRNHTGLLDACKEAAKVHLPHSKLGLQLHSAIAMAENPHTPRRPAADLLQADLAIARLKDSGALDRLNYARAERQQAKHQHQIGGVL